MSSSVNQTLRGFYIENRQQLYTYAVSITHHREAAEDAIHQTFQQLLRRGDLPADLRPYIFRSVRNAALDTLRRAKTRGDSIFDESSMAAVPAANASPALSVAELNEWLAKLSEDERETIVLKIFESFSFQEVADLRRVPLSTATSWYRRGLAKLKTIVAQENL
jgi:RNA polymerase sigma-70 factor (ECF subfamily)